MEKFFIYFKLKREIQFFKNQYLNCNVLDLLNTQQFICNRSIIDVLNNIFTFYSQLYNEDNLSGKVILTSIVVAYFTDQMIDIKNLEKEELNLIQYSKILNKMLLSNKINIRHFYVVCSEYSKCFQEWKQKDVDKVLSEIFQYYNELEQVSNKLDEVERKTLDNEKVKLLQRIKKLDKTGEEKLLKYIDDNKNKTVEEKIIELHTTTIKLAFWDKIISDVQENNFLSTIQLLKDVKDMICVLVPSKQTELDEYIDIDFITTKISDNILTPLDIMNLLSFVESTITSLETSLVAFISLQLINDTKWRDVLSQQIKMNIPLHMLLPQFFKTAFNKLENIEKLSRNYVKTKENI